MAASLPSVAVAPRVAGAQQYPTRPVRIIVPYGAGGAVDLVARLVAQELTKRMGQTVLVENRTGGGGNVAMESVARAQPDGYTLLMASPALTINPSLYDNLPYDPAKQLEAIGLVGEVPTVLLGSPSLPVKDTREFVELARARPGTYTFASGSTGTSEHLAGEMLKFRAGLDISHIAYRSGPAAITSLFTDNVSVTFTNLANALAHIRSGQVKALGIADQTRSPIIPDVPTLAELGIPDFNVSVWWGLVGPAGMPRSLVTRINKELVASLSTDEARQGLERMTAKPLGGSPEDFNRLLERERRDWGEVIRRSGVKVQ
jgi:tripartite-type tricarboxylate transporter receptor subunit TctC